MPSRKSRRVYTCQWFVVSKCDVQITRSDTLRPMAIFNLGPIRFVVEHRAVGADGGPTLRVCDQSGGRELLRFDCFAKNPHWHVDPSGNEVIQKIEAAGSPIDWTLSELRGGLSALLARAEFTAELPGGYDSVLDAVEDALRNPPTN